jgi:hypothetical protein
MQGFVNGWCRLIGITDETSIQIAVGIVGGGLALLIVLVLWTWANAIFIAIIGGGGRR